MRGTINDSTDTRGSIASLKMIFINKWETERLLRGIQRVCVLMEVIDEFGFVKSVLVAKVAQVIASKTLRISGDMPSKR